MLIDYEKEFLKTFHILTYENTKWKVWEDFILMSACSISNAIAKNDYANREKRYLQIINNYSKRDQQLFPKLFAKVVMALESNTEQDFLGHIYMELGLGNHVAGQFFTPYDICKLMSRITISDDIDKEVNKKGYVSICDTACGAGATLISAANLAREILKKSGKNFQNYILFVGQDIDVTVGLMCYLQISLLGCSGYVKIGNSLTDPIKPDDDINKYWFTPMYFSDRWKMLKLINKTNILLS